MPKAQAEPSEASKAAEAAALDDLSSQLNATVRDALLIHLRAMRAVWPKLAESEQQDIISAVEKTARDVIRQTVEVVSQRGFDHIGIRLKDLQIKDGGIKGKFEASMVGDNVQLLAEHENMAATIVLTDAGSFMLGAWAEAEPDQPEMELGPDEDQDEQEDDQRRAPRRRRA